MIILRSCRKMETVICALVGGYAVTSLLLLRFPCLLHRKKNLSFKAFKISHRGGAGEGIENTIEAYKNAIKNGSEMLEMDCHMTKDGEVVVVHDCDLSMVAERPAVVSSTHYGDLPRYKTEVSVTFHKDYTTQVGEETDRSIPLLKEVFEKFPNIPMNIDLKQNSDELVRKVADLIKTYERKHLTVWGGLSSRIARRCYSEDSEIPMFCSMKKVFLIMISFYFGLLPFLPIRESCFEIPMPSIGHRLKEFSFFNGLLLNVIDHLLVNRYMFRHLQRRGIRVYVWVLNEEEDFKRAISYGVDGIMTDFPSKLNQFVEAEKK